MSDDDYSGVREGGEFLSLAGVTLAVAAVILAISAYFALAIYLELALNAFD